MLPLIMLVLSTPVVLGDDITAQPAFVERPEHDLWKGLISQIELRHIDYDSISGGRISAHPPGTYEAWRMRITDFIEALITKKR